MTHRVFLSVAGIPFLLCAEIFGTQAKEIRPLFVQQWGSPLPGGKISPVGHQIRPVVGCSEPPLPYRDMGQGTMCLCKPWTVWHHTGLGHLNHGSHRHPCTTGTCEIGSYEQSSNDGDGERLGRDQPSRHFPQISRDQFIGLHPNMAALLILILENFVSDQPGCVNWVPPVSEKPIQSATLLWLPVYTVLAFKADMTWAISVRYITKNIFFWIVGKVSLRNRDATFSHNAIYFF